MKTKITRDVVSKLEELTNAVVTAEETASELLRTAQDRFNHVEEEVDRDGAKQKIARKTLWEEVFYLGVKCQAAEILRKHHPEVFEAYATQDKSADDLKKFCVLELNIDFTKMRIRDYLMLTEAMFDLKLAEWQVENTKALSGQ